MPKKQIPISNAVEEFEENVAPFVAGADILTSLLFFGIIILLTLSLSAVVIHRRQWPLTEDV